jgi:hypothetical protein
MEISEQVAMKFIFKGQIALANVGIAILKSPAVTDVLWMDESNETAIEHIFHHLDLDMGNGSNEELVAILNKFVLDTSVHI